VDYNNTLQEIGFKQIEAEIYIYLLKKGSSSQQRVSDDTGILRQTVYDMMNKMERKGQISASKRGKRKIYSAVDPKILLSRLKEKEESFLQILPDLEKIKSMKKPEIFSESFIGIPGLKNLFNLTLLSKTEILWLANIKQHINLFKDYYWQNYALKRAEKKIPIKLMIDSKTKLKTWSTNKKLQRYAKQSDFVNNINSSFAVFDDKIIIYSLDQDQPYGVFIQNPTLKNMFEQIFMHHWNNAKEF